MPASSEAAGPRAGEEDRLFEPGEVVDGKYRLGPLLGAGAMGLVFEAEHLLLDKKVALKVLRPELTSDDDLRRRFEIEARAAAAVEHPNVVTVTDMGTTRRGAVYFVMDRLVGETLAERLDREGPMELPAVAAIALPILDGLEAAHARGLVHRDLKLENVFLASSPGGRDRVKILDFGVAKVNLGGGSASATRTGVVIGTPEFMAPEQARAERDIDARVDLYALGVILYRMLSGRAPFTGDSAMAVLAALLTQRPPDLGLLCPELPPAVVTLVMAALERDRERRPRSAAEFRARLQAACAEPAAPRRERRSSASDLVPLDLYPAGSVAPEAAPAALRSPRPAPAAAPAEPVLELDAPPALALPVARPRRGQLAPTADEQRRFRRGQHLKRAAVTAMLLLVALGMWHALDWARPWRALERRLRPVPAEAVEAPAPRNVTVDVDVTPAGASLELDGEPLDRLRFQLFRSLDRHRLKASKDGYLPATVDIVADESKTIVIRLLRAPRRRARGDEAARKPR